MPYDPAHVHGKELGSPIGEVDELREREGEGVRGHDGRRKRQISPEARVNQRLDVEIGSRWGAQRQPNRSPMRGDRTGDHRVVRRIGTPMASAASYPTRFMYRV